MFFFTSTGLILVIFQLICTLFYENLALYLQSWWANYCTSENFRGQNHSSQVQWNPCKFEKEQNS